MLNLCDRVYLRGIVVDQRRTLDVPRYKGLIQLGRVDIVLVSEAASADLVADSNHPIGLRTRWKRETVPWSTSQFFAVPEDGRGARAVGSTAHEE